MTLPAGSSITYTVTGTVSGAAVGAITNTATVTTPAGVVDVNSHECTAVVKVEYDALRHEFFVA